MDARFDSTTGPPFPFFLCSLFSRLVRDSSNRLNPNIHPAVLHGRVCHVLVTFALNVIYATDDEFPAVMSMIRSLPADQPGFSCCDMATPAIEP